MAEPEITDSSSDVARIRSVLARELETINTYEALAREARSPETRAFLLHLANEEKEHVAEATALLRRLDAQLEAHFGKEYTLAHFQGAAAKVELPERLPTEPHRIVHALPAPPSRTAGQLTVGALRRSQHP